MLGDLVLYVTKKILPALGQKYQFKLPNTKEGDKHKLLQHKLASLLDIGDVEYEFFLTEAISIIIPIIIPINILPHRDKLNDGKNTKSGTVTLNCTLPISIITNKNPTIDVILVFVIQLEFMLTPHYAPRRAEHDTIKNRIFI